MPVNPVHTQRVVAFTVVTPDLDASIAFYRDAIGWDLLERDLLAEPLPMQGRGYALLRPEGEPERATLRLLEALPDAVPNRPRPAARAWDTGLAVLEFGTNDPAASFAAVTAFGAGTISPPRPYLFRGAGALGDVDVTSYAAFGPAGEQMFITHSIRRGGDGPARPPLQRLHGPVGNAVIPCPERGPVLDWYEAIFGVVPTVDEVCLQETVNEIIGAPADTQFQMIMLGPEAGRTIGIEVEEYRGQQARSYPTDLDKTGLAMITLRVDSSYAVRANLAGRTLAPLAEGALPLPGERSPYGFRLRGPAGELIEVVEG